MLLIIAQAGNSATSTWQVLIGALGGVIVTSAVALITAALNHRWQRQSTQDSETREQVKALRQERQAAYARCLIEAHKFHRKVYDLRIEQDPGTRTPLVTEISSLDSHMREAYVTAMLVSKDDIARELAETIESVIQYFNTVYQIAGDDPHSQEVADADNAAISAVSALQQRLRKELSQPSA
jgi:hypothetical protein